MSSLFERKIAYRIERTKRCRIIVRGQRRREKESRGKLKITHNAQNIACGLLAVLLCREGDSGCLHSGLHTSALAPGKIGKRNENDNTLGGDRDAEKEREK